MFFQSEQTRKDRLRQDHLLIPKGIILQAPRDATDKAGYNPGLYWHISSE
jgi:hypothetical protein